MKETRMEEALKRAASDVSALIDERMSDIKQDMASSFMAQAEEDPDKKLSYKLSIGIKIVPTCDGAVVETDMKWKVSKKATAQSAVGE